MEVAKSFTSDLGFLQKKMASFLAETETLVAAHRSLSFLLKMMGPLLEDVVSSPTLNGIDQREVQGKTLKNEKTEEQPGSPPSEWFLFSELHRRNKTEPEAKDGSDDDDDDDDDDAEEPDDDGEDEDFSGEEGEADDDDDDDDAADPDEDPATNGNQDDDDDDDDDDEDGKDDDDDDEEGEEEEEDDDDEEEQPPAKKRK